MRILSRRNVKNNCWCQEDAKGTKRDQHIAKRSQREPTGFRGDQEWNQKGAQREPKGARLAQSRKNAVTITVWEPKTYPILGPLLTEYRRKSNVRIDAERNMNK